MTDADFLPALLMAAPGWTSLDQCRDACRAQSTVEGLEALSAGLMALRDDRNVSLLTQPRTNIIAARMAEIERGR